MKKNIFITALSLCVLLLFACAFIPASADNAKIAGRVVESGALNARFLNMLNRNFVYNCDFENADVITENSVLALLDSREGPDGDYISENVVKGFISDMYGVYIVDITEDEKVHKDGYVYITPRGFTSYTHRITDVVPNEDGSFNINGIGGITADMLGEKELVCRINEQGEIIASADKTGAVVMSNPAYGKSLSELIYLEKEQKAISEVTKDDKSIERG